MATTFLKLSELYREKGQKEYNEYIDFLNKKFNSYSLDTLCDGIDGDDFPLCGKYLDYEVSYDTFKRKVEDYKKVQETKKNNNEQINNDISLRVLLNKILDFISFVRYNQKICRHDIWKTTDIVLTICYFVTVSNLNGIRQIAKLKLFPDIYCSWNSRANKDTIVPSYIPSESQAFLEILASTFLFLPA